MSRPRPKPKKFHPASITFDPSTRLWTAPFVGTTTITFQQDDLGGRMLLLVDNLAPLHVRVRRLKDMTRDEIVEAYSNTLANYVELGWPAGEQTAAVARIADHGAAYRLELERQHRYWREVERAALEDGAPEVVAAVRAQLVAIDRRYPLYAVPPWKKDGPPGKPEKRFATRALEKLGKRTSIIADVLDGGKSSTVRRRRQPR